MTVPPSPQSIIGITETKIMQDIPQATNTISSWCAAEWRGIFAELISTMMLVLFGCMACLPMEGIDSSLYGPFGFGFMVMLNIQIFGHISGAYMNPAVTLAAVIWGRISIPVGIVYAIMECAGAMLGFGILMALSPLDLVTGGVCVTAPYAGLTLLQGVGIEVVLTAALSFINCGVWDPVNGDKQDSAPIKFGLAIVGLSFVGGPMTGASMNPARSLGPAVWTNTWTQHWIYWVGPFVGSGIAAVIYKFALLKKRASD